MRTSTHCHFDPGERPRVRRIDREGSHWLELGGSEGIPVPIFLDRDQVVPLLQEIAATLTVDEALELLHSMTAGYDDETDVAHAAGHACGECGQQLVQCAGDGPSGWTCVACDDGRVWQIDGELAEAVA